MSLISAPGFDMFLLLVSISGLLAFVSLGRRLPRQNIVALAIIVVLASAVVEAISERFHIPFASTTTVGPRKLWGTVPWDTPLLWLALTVTARELMRLFFQNQKGKSTYAIATICGSAVLVALGWIPVCHTGQPGDLFGRFITAAALQLFISPWLIDKRNLQTSRI